MAKPGRVRYPARMNLRLTQETFDAFEEAAELLETEPTALVRLFVEGAVPSVQAMAQAARSVRAGRAVEAAELVQALAAQMVSQANLHQVQTEALRSDITDAVRESA